MIKKILYGLLVVIIVIVSCMIYGVRYFNNLWFRERPLYLEYQIENKPIHFEWANNTYGDHLEQHDALLIPVSIEGLPYDFYVQFDTGTPFTVLAGRAFNTLKEMLSDSSTSTIEENNFLDSLNFNLGGANINAQTIQILENYSRFIDPADTLTISSKKNS